MLDAQRQRGQSGVRGQSDSDSPRGNSGARKAHHQSSKPRAAVHARSLSDCETEKTLHFVKPARFFTACRRCAQAERDTSRDGVRASSSPREAAERLGWAASTKQARTSRQKRETDSVVRTKRLVGHGTCRG